MRAPWKGVVRYIVGLRIVTRIGKLELRVPRDRDGRFSTELFDRYQRSEKALVSALARARDFNELPSHLRLFAAVWDGH